MTHFGTSAKFIDAAAKLGLTPGGPTTCQPARMFSTGSPLSPEGFDWVYREIKQDLILLSRFPAAPDIISCFVLGNPLAAGLSRRDPVPRTGHGGGCVRRKRPAGAQGKGRTVCTKPFP